MERHRWFIDLPRQRYYLDLADTFQDSRNVAQKRFSDVDEELWMKAEYAKIIKMLIIIN